MNKTNEKLLRETVLGEAEKIGNKHIYKFEGRKRKK
jgi:hypothetical protein